MEQILKLHHVCKDFQIGKKGVLHALTDVSFHMDRQEIVALVGESGCGKSTLARLITGMEKPTSGDIIFDGRKAGQFKKEELRQYRRDVQMIFQNPRNICSPRMKIGTFLMEPWINYEKKSRKEAKMDALYSLRRVYMKEDTFSKYPHELSGGEMQRVAIARAIALHPRLLICDEATSALDVSIQKEILHLLKEHFQKAHASHDFSILFITHDLALAEEFCDRIVVMYLGTVVETLKAHVLQVHARHPYTKALLASSFEIYGRQESAISLLKGEPPDPSVLPQGCVFYGRCPCAMDVCRYSRPALRRVREGHYAACHRE